MAKKLKLYPMTNEWRFSKKSGKRKKMRSPGDLEPKPRVFLECPNCGRNVRQLNDGRLKAHQWASNGRWCKAGAPPTPAQRGKKGSVWTSGSAGLPGLGKR